MVHDRSGDECGLCGQERKKSGGGDGEESIGGDVRGDDLRQQGYALVRRVDALMQQLSTRSIITPYLLLPLINRNATDIRPYRC